MKTHNINTQETVFLEEVLAFPSTRYQGSKLKIVHWIWENIRNIQFHSVLDAFSGTGSVAYMLKTKGKKVAYNDILKFNWYIGLALIENSYEKLTQNDVDFIINKHNHINYPSFIHDNFHDIYFTDKENQWLDVVATNIEQIDSIYKKALAYFALFQACIIKRPFNLFHRKNLYLRFSNVQRNFGNKTTWDTCFEKHFKKFVGEANNAVFPNGQENKAYNLDIFDMAKHFDLIYIDTPYISKKEVGVDYFSFYHFLEGLINYSNWEKMIDYKSKHRRLKGNGSVWIDKNKIHSAFDKLFSKFRNSILVVSYRSDGIPSIAELEDIMKKYKRKVIEIKRKKYKYVLSNNHSEEVLIIGE